MSDRQPGEAREKIPGIIGGMGPEATVDLLQRIVANTPALDDVDHIRCIVDNNPKIPSRIKAILGMDGVNPGPPLAEMAKRLEQWGADFLAIPCNTAHYYYNWVADAVSIPVIHLIDLVVEKVTADNPDLRKVGILGSTTIVKTELYASRFAQCGVEVVYPAAVDQDQLFALIRAVKKGDTGQEVAAGLVEICTNLARRGVPVCILGCTELGVIRADLPIAGVDAAEVLAQEIVAVVKQGKAPCIGKN